MTLLELLGADYAKSAEMTDLQNAQQQMVDEFQVMVEELDDQLDPRTATWGLPYWEQALGLEGAGRAEAYRRNSIVARLRGVGTTTVSQIVNLAAAFSNGAVTVTEHPSTYSLDITFVGTIGIPPNLDDLTASLDAIMPAHITYQYVYVYTTWAMSGDETWTDAADETWDSN